MASQIHVLLGGPSTFLEYKKEEFLSLLICLMGLLLWINEGIEIVSK